MKYVLAGDVVTASQRFFTLCTGLVKVLGIVLVVAGRLNVGREGALTQIAGCIAYFLMRKVQPSERSPFLLDSDKNENKNVSVIFSFYIFILFLFVDRHTKFMEWVPKNVATGGVLRGG